MRPAPNALIEPYRQRVDGARTSAAGNNGHFRIPCGKTLLNVVASDGGGWDHVSVSLADRCPTWEEMCHIKELFFRSDEWVMQLHPPKTCNINNHPFCLHLWRPQEATIPLPQAWMVGFANVSPEQLKAMSPAQRQKMVEKLARKLGME